MNRKTKIKTVDAASFLTLVVTIALFVAALFEKGLTHDMLLEAGVFLVSVKLVMSSYKTNIGLKSINEKLDLLVNRDPDKPQLNL